MENSVTKESPSNTWYFRWSADGSYPECICTPRLSYTLSSFIKDYTKTIEFSKSLMLLIFTKPSCFLSCTCFICTGLLRWSPFWPHILEKVWKREEWKKINKKDMETNGITTIIMKKKRRNWKKNKIKSNSNNNSRPKNKKLNDKIFLLYLSWFPKKKQ